MRATRWIASSRETYLWGTLFGAAFLVRTAMDWFAPPVDFQMRALISTALAAGILLAAGCWAAWRSSSPLAGTVAGVATAVIGALVSAAGVGLLLMVRHDAATIAAIRGSGGIAEAFVLPFVTALPAALIGTVGGMIGAAMRRISAA